MISQLNCEHLADHENLSQEDFISVAARYRTTH